VLNLKTGEYAPQKESKLESVEAAKAGLAALLSHSDVGGRYAASVLMKTLHYAASLVPEISDTIRNIDDAMRMGYAWKYGPFELIDRLKFKDQEGSAIFAAKCTELGLPVPAIIAAAKGRPLYTIENGEEKYMGRDGAYHTLHHHIV